MECISGADCAGTLVCDVATHTCVSPPDASASDAAADGSADASLADAEASLDGAVDAAGDAADASKPDAAGPAVVAVPPEDGSLAGGAWDCGLANAPDGGRFSLAAIASPLAIGALFGVRRRRRRR